MFKRDLPQRTYLIKLKNIIQSNTIGIKKRLNNFPVKTLKSTLNYSFDEDTKVSIDGAEYDIKDAIRESLDRYQELLKETKNTSYNDVLQEFIVAARGKRHEDLESLYQTYVDKLSDRMNNDKQSLYFCLNVIKVVSSTLKVQNKKRKENE